MSVGHYVELSVINKMYFQPRCLRTILGVRWQDDVSNETVRSRCLVPMSLAQLVHLHRLGWAGHVLRRDKLIVQEMVFSRANSKRRGRHRTLVADLADDINHVCCFANHDKSLPQNIKQFNRTMLVRRLWHKLAILAASNAPAVRSYGYISKSWYRKHLSKWAKPTGAIMG